MAAGYSKVLPEFHHYNPIGTVHGGFAATLLDLRSVRDFFDPAQGRYLDYVGA